MECFQKESSLCCIVRIHVLHWINFTFWWKNSCTCAVTTCPSCERSCTINVVNLLLFTVNNNLLTLITNAFAWGEGEDHSSKKKKHLFVFLVKILLLSPNMRTYLTSNLKNYCLGKQQLQKGEVMFPCPFHVSYWVTESGMLITSYLSLSFFYFFPPPKLLYGCFIASFLVNHQKNPSECSEY